MKLSIITICLNEEKTIEKTILSVISQTFHDYEFIIIDGDSKDDTKKIIKKYLGKIDVFISEKDTGIYNAMNKGIKHSKGELLLFLNGGDYLNSNDILERVFNFIKTSNNEIEIFYGNVIKENADEVSAPLNTKKINLEYFISRVSIHHQATFIRRHLFDKYGFYEENYKYAGDYELFIRMIILNKIKIQFLPFIVSTININGISHNPKNKKLIHKEIYSIQRKHLYFKCNTLYIYFLEIKLAIYKSIKFILKKIGIIYLIKKYIIKKTNML